MKNEEREKQDFKDRLYNCENLLLFEYSITSCRITILQQPEMIRPSIFGTCDGKQYEITSSSCIEVREDIFFMKGSQDFYRNNASYSAPIYIAKRWERIMKRLKAFTIVLSMEEAEKLKIAQEEEPKTGREFKIDLEPTEEDIKKMISLVDLDVFCKIIQSRLVREKDGCFSGYEKPKMSDVGQITHKWAEEYLQEWAKAKFRFYKLFGDKLSICEEFDNIPTTGELNNGINTLKTKFPLYAPIIEHISVSCFEKNKMILGDYYYNFNEIKNVDKMTLTKFFSLYGNEELNNEISKIYQNKGKVKMEISINPIDYLTVSINNCSWKSCHNFLDGAYANAGLAYMHDNYSLVSFAYNDYTKYSSSQFYKSFEWNNKKWRQMIYISDKNSGICFSRQYPSYDDRFEEHIRQMIEDVWCKYFDVENKWYIGKNNNGSYIDIGSNKSARHIFYNDVNEGFNFKTIIHQSDAIRGTRCELGAQPKKMLHDGRIDEGGERVW